MGSTLVVALAKEHYVKRLNREWKDRDDAQRKLEGERYNIILRD